ncbi:MAG: type VII secretion protein EssC [Oscillospiraceae bacterium]|nr:type VII secretion protein EssC [Oscillospiraceae bacterium]
MSGFAESLPLSLEVWEGKWYMSENASVRFGARVDLRGGLRIDCTVRRSGEKFVVIVEDAPADYMTFQKYVFGYGRISVGRQPDNNIRFNIQKLVSGYHAALERGADGICYVTDSSQNGTFVNGKRVDGRRELRFGDTVGIFGLKIVFLGDVVAVNRPAEDCAVNGLTAYAPPPDERGAARDGANADEYYLRSPRLVERLDNEEIEIEAPPNVNKSRRQPLIFTIGPSMTMVIPMAAGALFTMLAARQSGQSSGAFMFMGIITSVTAAVIGIFWALMNVRYQKRTEAAEAAGRETMFGQYLARMRRVLEEKHSVNKGILDRLYPHTRECLEFTREGGLRLWERNVNHSDFLSVRLGIGDVPSPNAVKTPKEKFAVVPDALADEPRKLREEFAFLRGVPVTLSLSEHRLVGVIADSGDKLPDIARSIAVQLAAYHSYTDLRMAFLYPKRDAGKYAFARWLPHVWSEDGETRMIAEDQNGAGEILYSISSRLRARMRDEGEDGGKREGRALPHYVIFVADPALIEGEAMSKYLYSPDEELGVSVVLLYGSIGQLPNSCSVLIRHDAGFRGFCSLDNAFGDRGGVTFDGVTQTDAAAFARSLAGFRIREEQTTGAAPAMLSFLDMYKVSRADELDVYRNWLNNRSFESMRAMIGYKNSDTPLYLDIHEKYHGPHGLVAGTTGSGKSETLQTYILSLAVSFDPREVSFILIDYKGGGMAKSFEGMPHVAGIITNLGGNQTNRALASINSEIKRRQTVFNEYGVKHIDEYIELFRSERADSPTPHLLIISDEFAELKKEQPDFVRELVSAARVGRSLGIHLILATQDPSASVDDEIWSNSKFRLCLRVAGKQNSQAMLHRPDAAYITNAGRGYFQVGNDEIFELFQSGWSGAEYSPEQPYGESGRGDDIKMINLWGRAAVKPAKKKAKSSGESVTQLGAVTQYITQLAKEKNIQAIADIWLPPLPERVALAELAGAERGRGSLAVTLGLADYPTGQRQFAYSYDLAEDGHLMIAGPGGAGKTTLLQTLLYGLVTGFAPERVNVYIADFNSRTLGVFAKMPHCGGVIYDSDADKTDKLMKMLSRELSRRVVRFSERGIGAFKEYSKLYDDVPAIVFAVDNFAAFTENNDKLQDALMALTRQSASYGIYLVFTCTNSSDVRGRIRQNIGGGIGLQMPDRFEYEDVLGMKPAFLADDRVTGRGLAVCDAGGEKPDVLEVQFALALDAPDGASRSALLRDEFAGLSARDGAGAPKIPQVPEDMSVENLLALPEIAEKCKNPRYLPLGYDVAEASPVFADLTDAFCFTIGGAQRSGKTTLLKAIGTMASGRGYDVSIFDGQPRELESFAQQIGAARYMASSDELYEYMDGVIVPEIKRRNPRKGEYLDGGCADPDAYFASERKLFLLINDMSAFCEAVYSSERDMKGYIEGIFIPKGKQHMVYAFACISPDDYTGEWGTKPVLRKFAGYKEGLHLGGNIDNQRVFDFEIPILQRGQKLPAGQGHIVDGDATKRIAAITV